MEKYSLYKYFKGEKENPFKSIKQNTQHQFWGYEQLFEDKFNAGDFSTETWIPPNTPDVKEWGKFLADKPVDKEELFKLWMYNLLMVHLPEKYQEPGDSFLRLYYDTEL